jgi:hypothetical protein
VTASLARSDSIVLLFSCSDGGERVYQRARERCSSHLLHVLHYYVRWPIHEVSSVRAALLRLSRRWWQLRARVGEAWRTMGLQGAVDEGRAPKNLRIGARRILASSQQPARHAHAPASTSAPHFHAVRRSLACHFTLTSEAFPCIDHRAPALLLRHKHVLVAGHSIL